MPLVGGSHHSSAVGDDHNMPNPRATRLFLNIDQLACLARKYKIVFKLFVFEVMITTRQTLFIIRFSIIRKVCVPMYLNYLASRSTSRYCDPQFFRLRCYRQWYISCQSLHKLPSHSPKRQREIAKHIATEEVISIRQTRT